MVKRIKKEKPQLMKSNQRNFWIEFIELYKAKTVLWKISREHVERETKRDAYKELVQKLKEFNEEADTEMVKNKLNSFRACYRRELRKIRQSRNSGSTYVPSWWCFEHLRFLNEHNVRAKIEDSEQNNASDDELELDDEFTVIQASLPSPIAAAPKHTKAEMSFQHQHDDTQNYKDLVIVTADSESAMCKPAVLNWSNDELDIVCKGWALQYRDLTKQQKLFAKKAIDDILFEAQMGTLHRNSVKLNEDHRCTHCGCKNTSHHL